VASAAVTLSALTDRASVARRLAAAGLSDAAARAKAELFARCAEALAAGGGRRSGAGRDAGAHAFFVPGRIEVLGKHTDYAGGRSIVAAIERGICLVAAPREEPLVRARALDLADEREFRIGADLAPAVGHWSNYAETVARRMAQDFPGGLCGADIAFSGDLPPAAGMSSSSALVVAFFLALAAANRLRERREFQANIAGAEDLAEYLGCVENGQTFRALAGDRGVGTFGGSEDHVAMLCSRADMLSQYSYCPVRLERGIAVPDGHIFAVASSGVAAEKTGGAMEKYNRASRLAAEAARMWCGATGRQDAHMAAALRSGEGAAARLRAVLSAAPPGGPFSPRELAVRFEHFLAESEEIIPAAGDALADGRPVDFGRLADRSQRLAETLLGNQAPETIFLARSARELGAVGASAFGAGFGGSVWALVSRGGADSLLGAWAARYREAFPAAAGRARFFSTGAGPAVIEIDAVQPLPGLLGGSGDPPRE